MSAAPHRAAVCAQVQQGYSLSGRNSRRSCDKHAAGGSSSVFNHDGSLFYVVTQNRDSLQLLRHARPVRSHPTTTTPPPTTDAAAAAVFGDGVGTTATLRLGGGPGRGRLGCSCAREHGSIGAGVPASSVSACCSSAAAAASSCAALISPFAVSLRTAAAAAAATAAAVPGTSFAAARARFGAVCVLINKRRTTPAEHTAPPAKVIGAVVVGRRRGVRQRGRGR